MFAGGADGGNGHLPRPRRARRGGGGGGGMGSPPLGPPPPPCTDYDMAYFKAYSHIGVHEEMLKVSRPTCASLSLSHSPWFRVRAGEESWGEPFVPADGCVGGLGFIFQWRFWGSDSWDHGTKWGCLGILVVALLCVRRS